MSFLQRSRFSKRLLISIINKLFTTTRRDREGDSYPTLQRDLTKCTSQPPPSRLTIGLNGALQVKKGYRLLLEHGKELYLSLEEEIVVEIR